MAVTGYDPEACLTVPGRLVLGPTQAGVTASLVPTPASPLTAPTVTATSPDPTGDVHWFAVDFVNAQGEGGFGASFVAVAMTPGLIHATYAAIPIGPVGTTARVLYVTKATSPSTGLKYTLTQQPPARGDFFVDQTLANNTATTATINKQGSALVTSPPTPVTAYGGSYGGTFLGYVAGCTVVKETEFAYALSESLAIDRAKTYRGATKAALVFTLVQYDSLGYDKLWASVTTSQGGFAGANTLSLPQPGRTLTPGLVAPSSSVLFLPDNDQHPAVLIYAPAWCDETRQRLALVLNKPLESLVVLVCGLDASSRDLLIGRLQDLVIT